MHLTIRHIFSIFSLLITSILLRDQNILNVVFLSLFKIKNDVLLLLYNSQLASLENYRERFSSYVKGVEVVLENGAVIECFSSVTDNDNFEKRVFQINILVIKKYQLKFLLICYYPPMDLELKV